MKNKTCDPQHFPPIPDTPGLDMSVRIGGQLVTDDSYDLSVELIDFKGQLCTSHAIPDFPVNVNSHSVVTLTGSVILVLGGMEAGSTVGNVEFL